MLGDKYNKFVQQKIKESAIPRYDIERPFLVEQKLSSYRERIFIKDVFPHYAKVLKLINFLKSQKEKETRYDVLCNNCCMKSCCSNTYCPCINTGIPSDDLNKKIEGHTVKQVIEGTQPFAFIIQVDKWKQEDFRYMSNEFRKRDNETYLIFCSNPMLYIDNYKHIRYQLNNNVYQKMDVINVIDYKLYLYIYKKLILAELASFGLIDNSQSNIIENCQGCCNQNSPICQICCCKSNTQPIIYYDDVDGKGDIQYSPSNWSYRNYTKLVNLDRDGTNNLYIEMLPFNGHENILNSTAVRVKNTVKYALYLRWRYRSGLFQIRNVKDVMKILKYKTYPQVGDKMITSEEHKIVTKIDEIRKDRNINTVVKILSKKNKVR